MDLGTIHADQTRFRALFADLDPVPLREGLANTIAWFESEASE